MSIGNRGEVFLGTKEKTVAGFTKDDIYYDEETHKLKIYKL